MIISVVIAAARRGAFNSGKGERERQGQPLLDLINGTLILQAISPRTITADTVGPVLDAGNSEAGLSVIVNARGRGPVTVRLQESESATGPFRTIRRGTLRDMNADLRLRGRRKQRYLRVTVTAASTAAYQAE